MSEARDDKLLFKKIYKRAACLLASIPPPRHFSNDLTSCTAITTAAAELLSREYFFADFAIKAKKYLRDVFSENDSAFFFENGLPTVENLTAERNHRVIALLFMAEASDDLLVKKR